MQIFKEDRNTIDYLTSVAYKLKEIVGKRTLVVLGRDAWVLVPLLRKLGVKTHYFLYSRHQYSKIRWEAEFGSDPPWDPENHETTKQAWLREVPKGSYVLDTGYAGSIIDDIKSFDPTVKGILISSTGHYPQLEIDSDELPSIIVKNIEEMPKLTGRSYRYKGDIVLTKNPKEDLGDVDSDSAVLSMHKKIKKNERVLKDFGLPEKDVEKYKSFTGIPISQRIGSDEITSHLFNVDRQRRTKDYDRYLKQSHKKNLTKRFSDLVDDVIEEKISPKIEKHRKWIDSLILSNESYYIVEKIKEESNRLKEILHHYKYELNNTPKWDKEKFDELSEGEKSTYLKLNALNKFKIHILKPVNEFLLTYKSQKSRYEENLKYYISLLSYHSPWSNAYKDIQKTIEPLSKKIENINALIEKLTELHDEL